MNAHPVELIGAYADGELPPERAREVESHLARCTECNRELALIKAIGGALRSELNRPPQRSVWGGVQARLTRSVGWLLFVAGVVLWVALAVAEWFRERVLSAEWLASTAIVIGLVLLAVGVAYEQYREWKDSPYKDLDL